MNKVGFKRSSKTYDFRFLIGKHFILEKDSLRLTTVMTFRFVFQCTFKSPNINYGNDGRRIEGVVICQS